MKITTFATWGSINDFLAGKPADREVSYEHDTEFGKLDRWEQGAEKSAVNTDKQVAGQAGSQAASDESQLTPFASQEMNAQHLYNPYQTNELLTAAGAGIGGAEGATEGAADRAAATTRNASGFAKDLDLAARERAKAGAGVSEGVAAQDVMGAKQLNQQGAGLMSDLFKTDTSKQLQAMGQETQDIAGEVKAGQSGWLQNVTGVLDTASKFIKPIGK